MVQKALKTFTIQRGTAPLFFGGGGLGGWMGGDGI